jgi:uncharacterized protein (DUF58 family)
MRREGAALDESRTLRRRLLRHVRSLQIRCAAEIDQELAGSYDSALKGAGIEFEETRPYLPGDDVRTIDWRVTARSGQPFVKRFREERQLTVHLLVDVSGSMVGPRPERSVRDVAIEVAALVALLAAHEGDRIGLTLFSDQIEKEVPPCGGIEHALRIVRDLLAARPRRSGTDLGQALARICRTQRRRGAIVVLSDFLDDRAATPLRVASRQHQMMPIVLSEPADRQLPRWGLLRARDPETGRRVWIDAFSRRQRREYEAAAEQTARRLDALLAQLRVPALKLTPQSDVARELRRYLDAWSRPR